MYISVLLFYCIAYAPFGISFTDEDFTFSLGYRIWNGQLPYRDFIYIRPPLSPMIQAGIISVVPIDLAFLASRLYFYIGVFVYSYVAAMLIGQYFELSGYGTNKYYLATLAFVLSVHNFPPMPWHTTDGILFSTIAMYLLLSRKA